MPCRSEYMEPNAREIESQRVAKLLIYVNESLNKPITEITYKASQDSYGNPEALDDMTNELCTLCRGMTNKQKKEILYNGESPSARKLADWWDEHQAFDRKRKHVRLAKIDETIKTMKAKIKELQAEKKTWK